MQPMYATFVTRACMCSHACTLGSCGIGEMDGDGLLGYGEEKATR